MKIFSKMHTIWGGAYARERTISEHRTKRTDKKKIIHQTNFLDTTCLATMWYRARKSDPLSKEKSHFHETGKERRKDLGPLFVYAPFTASFQSCPSLKQAAEAI